MKRFDEIFKTIEGCNCMLDSCKCEEQEQKKKAIKKALEGETK